jgi:hypothetical protein
LLLSACPELSWNEARKILRRTAVKIDAVNADATGIWRDAKGVLFGNRGYAGPHYSRGYGFGRIDAFLAVDAALARRSFWARAAACVTAALRFRHCGGGDTHGG